jgi:pimeloyl-ACP methyl ester carboxylesterase
MLRRSQLAGPILLISLAAPLYSQQSSPWRDPSPHSVQFVTVDKNVRLEVLDWGGSGRAVVLLAGGGDTAHIFDEFAPKLAADYHVYGITRRGFGASSVPASGYGADRLGDDVLAVLDSLRLNSFPEAEYRQGWDSTPDGRVGRHRNFPGAIMKGMKKYTDITVPALVIFAIPHDQGTWVNNSTDPAVRDAAKAYSAAEVVLTERQAKAFENGVPTARVVRLPGAHHYAFLSNEAGVLREMHAFLAGLQ